MKREPFGPSYISVRQYRTDEEVIAAVEKFFRDKMRASVSRGLKDSSIAEESV